MRRASTPEVPAVALLRLLPFASALLFLAPIYLAAQTSPPATAQLQTQPSAPAPITMEQEQQHHLVFENSYVKVFYVEIPPHESTLYHRHELPYISLPPPPLSDAPSPAGSPNTPNARSTPPGPHVSYAPGGFSHTVNNTSDRTLRNIAIELVRPQGTVRNLSEQVVRDQPANNRPTLIKRGLGFVVQSLFETDEIRVEYWKVFPNSTVMPADWHFSSLWGGADGIVEAVANGDSRPIPQAGLAWLLPGSKTTFRTGDAPGHFVTIVFKDSAPKP